MPSFQSVVLLPVPCLVKQSIHGLDFDINGIHFFCVCVYGVFSETRARFFLNQKCDTIHL